MDALALDFFLQDPVYSLARCRDWHHLSQLPLLGRREVLEALGCVLKDYPKLSVAGEEARSGGKGIP